MIGWLLKSLIIAYQRWLSPFKGFSCAHRIMHGGTSCSGYALQILESESPLRLLQLMHQRFRDCANADASLRAQRTVARISNSTYPSPELPPEPNDASVTGVDWYSDHKAADRYARSGYDDEGERAVKCCTDLTVGPQGCFWRLLIGG